METVVFLPGYLAPPAGFRAMSEALAGYRIVEPPRMPRPVQALELWRSAVPEGSHLVAFAEAAWSAVQLAAEKKAKSLVLLSPVVRLDAALDAKLSSFLSALSESEDTALNVMTPWFFGPVFLEQGQEAIGVWRESLDRRGIQAWLNALFELPDGRKNLRRLECPVLVVLGAEDVFTPLRYGQEVVEWTPPNLNGLGAVRVSLEGCGHLAAWENLEEATALVAGFVGEAEGVSGAAPVWDKE